VNSSKIQFTDVTLRDGLQAEAKIIPTEAKVKLFEKLLRCGYSRLEITSFVSPKWIPQFAENDDFCRAVLAKPTPGAQVMAFVPNERGLDRLLAYDIPWVSCFTATSETFNKKNINLTIDQTIDSLAKVVSRAHAAGRKVRLYLSTVFGCPYEGDIHPDRVVAVFKKLSDLNPDEIALGDTIGVATPDRVRDLLKRTSLLFPVVKTALHFHNTYGLALACALTAIDEGVTLFDGSTGGIGGCPYAKGATGNVPLELLAYGFFRSEKMAPFDAGPVFEVCDYLERDLGLPLHSPLYDIRRRGGTLYGLPFKTV
jgi:hydroxymethylglutaryl-CoA lyase